MGYLLFTNEVTSVNGQVGAVLLGVGNIPGAAPLASPAFTGTPTAPTPATADNSTTLATTAHVQAKIAANAPALAPVQSVAGRTGAVTLAVADVSGAQAALGYTPINKAGDSGIGNLSMGALTASGTLVAPYLRCSNLSTACFISNWAGANYCGIGSDGITHKLRIGVSDVYGNWQTAPGDMVVQIDGQLSATTGTFSGPVAPGTYTVATLPAGTAGMMAYASNGRKAGEGAGAGTGVLAIYTNSAWRDPSQAYAVVVA